MAIIPESLVERIGASISKVRQVNPAAAKTSAARGTASVKETIQLAVGYLKQETVGPLKNLGRFLAFGIIGAMAIGFGLVMLCLAVLRCLQRLTDPGDMWSGNLTWIPYLLTFLFAVLLIAVIVLGGLRGGKKAVVAQ